MGVAVAPLSLIINPSGQMQFFQIAVRPRNDFKVFHLDS